MKITAISEAFSMQPRVLQVSTEREYKIAKDREEKMKANSVNPERIISEADLMIKEITLQSLIIGYEAGDPIERLYYIAYNFEGQKIHQFLATSVNVSYQPEGKS